MSYLTRAVVAFCIAIAVSCATSPRRPLAVLAFADADSATVADIAPGVTHTFVRDMRGPWAFHVVEIDATRCTPVLEARKPGPSLAVRATTSELARDALVAVNAGFFMVPGGTPVGAHITRGVPLIGPTDRQIFAVTRGGWRVGVTQLTGSVRVRDDSTRLAQLNRPATSFSAYRGTQHGITLFTPWIGDSVPADSTARRIMLQLLDDVDVEAAGRAVIVALDSPAVMTRMQPGNAVLLAHGSANAWARRRQRGDTVSWHASINLPERVLEAVDGFPELLRDGQPVLAQQTVRAEFGAQRHPRTAIGWTAGRRLFFVAVDGRQAPHSDGMSLDELTWLFRRLGASHALNLDGGGSTAMVIRNRLVNRPSDPQGERAVGNALVLVGCR